MLVTNGQMLACFHSDGILPQLSDFLKIIKRIGEINSLHSLSILLGILSGPAALCGFRFFSNLFMPISVMLGNSSLLLLTSVLEVNYKLHTNYKIIRIMRFD